MEIQKETTIKIKKEEMLEKLGIKGKITFIQYDYKTEELTIKGNLEDQENDGGWFGFGK